MATYTVQSGDSWARIAGYYGNQRNFYELMLANPSITNLRPGQVLRIPRFRSNPNVPNDVAAAVGMATTGQIKAWNEAYPGQRMPSTPPPGWGTGGTGLGATTTGAVSPATLQGRSSSPPASAMSQPAVSPIPAAEARNTRPALTPQTGTRGGASTGPVGGSRQGTGTRTALAAPTQSTGAPFAPRQVLPTPNYGLPGGVNLTPRPGGGNPPSGPMQNPLNPQTWINAGQRFLPNLVTSVEGQTSPPPGAQVAPLGVGTGPQYTQPEIDLAFARAQMGTASDADWRVIEQNALAQGFTQQEVAQLRASVSGSQAQMPAPGNIFDATTGGALPGGAPPAGVPGAYWNTPGPVPMYPQFAAPFGQGGGRGGGRGGGGNAGNMGGQSGLSGLINWRYSG